MNDYDTQSDTDRRKGQEIKIFQVLSSRLGEYIDTGDLERFSGTTRVAAHIYTLRKTWLIDSRRAPSGRRAQYALIGKREGPRQKKAHCETCRCAPIFSKEYLTNHMVPTDCKNCGCIEFVNSAGGDRCGCTHKRSSHGVPPEQAMLL